MEEGVSKYNKATLIAAALIITGATAIFGTYASSNDEESSRPGPNPFACFEEVNQLTDEQKTKMQQAHDLFDAGDKEGAKAILDELGIKPPMAGHQGKGRGFGPGGRPDFMNNLTDEQKARMEEARKLMEAGDKEGAKAIFDELGLKAPDQGNVPGTEGNNAEAEEK